MKKVLKVLINTMMIIVTLWAIKVAVVDLWEPFMAVDIVDTVKRMMVL